MTAMAWPAAAGALFLAGSLFVGIGGRYLQRIGSYSLWMVLAMAANLVALSCEIWGLWQSGLRPGAHAYGALTYTLFAWQGFHVAILTLMAGYAVARKFAGLLTRERRLTHDNTRLLWHYATVQGLLALGIAHLFPMTTV